MLLFQPIPGALLQGQGLGLLLQLPLTVGQGVQQRGLLPLQGGQPGFGLAAAAGLVLLLGFQFQPPHLGLAQPFLQLALLRLQRPKPLLELLALLVALAALLHPAAGAAGHLPEPAA